MPLFENLKDTDGLRLSYCQLGSSYNGDGDYEKATAAVLQALKYTNKPLLNRWDSTALATSYIYLAEIYLNKKNLDSALYFGKKADTIDSMIQRNWNWVWYQLGEIYSEMKNRNEALIYYNKSLYTTWVKDSIDTYNGIAKLFLSDGKKDSAIFYANRALLLDVSHSYLPEKLESTTILSNAYEIKNNEDSILKYLRLSVSIKDSLFSQAKIREVQNLSLDEQLRQQEIRTSEEIYRNKLRTYVLAGILAVFLLIASILFRSNIHRRKAYVLLQKQKQEIDSQKLKVEQTLYELKSTQAQLIQSEKMAGKGCL